MKTSNLPRIVLAMLALGATRAMADRNFNNAQGDWQWFNPLNWQQGSVPTGDPSEGWTYINDSGMAAGKKSDAEHPVIIQSGTETAHAYQFNMGWGNDDTGTAEVYSDLVVETSCTIGRGQGSVASLSFLGGTVTNKANLTCGLLANAHGTVIVDGGTLNVSSKSSNDDFLKMGENGHGTFILRNGKVHLLSGLVLGNNPGSSGTAEISGGTLQVDRAVGHWMGDATWRQSGGDVNVNMTMTLGAGLNNGVTAKGFFDMTGGSLVVTQNLFAAQNGTCEWKHTGGRVEVANANFNLGNGGASVVDFAMGGDAVLVVKNEIYMAAGKSTADLPGARFTGVQNGGGIFTQIINMASQSNTVCRYTLDDGSIAVSNLFRVGLSGDARLVQNGGSVYAKGLNIAQQFADNFNLSEGVQGVYTVNGGTLDVGNQTNLGLLGGDGTLALLGGSSTFSNYVFVGRSAHATGKKAKGTLVIGGEADVSFLGEMAIGQDNAATGVLHLCGGGDGVHTHTSNLYLNNNPVLRATVDAKGLNGLNVGGNLQINTPLVVEPIRTRDAQPGVYPLLTWARGFTNAGISFAEGTDTSFWSLKLDTDAKTLYLTLKEPGTVILLK